MRNVLSAAAAAALPIPGTGVTAGLRDGNGCVTNLAGAFPE
jgi:hypothetical protein